MNDRGMSLAGLPLHPLVVHGAVVLIPAAAVMLLVCAPWPAARTRVGIAVPVLAAAGALFAVFATASGDSLIAAHPSDAAHRHAELGELARNVALLLMLAACGWWLAVTASPHGRLRALTHPGVRAGITVAAMMVAIGALVTAVLAGHSGAEAVWGG